MSSKKAFFQLLSVILERKSQSKLMNHGRHVEKKNWKWRNILNNFLSFLCHLNFWSWSHFFTSGSFFSDFLIWWMLYVVFFLFFFCFSLLEFVMWLQKKFTDCSLPTFWFMFLKKTYFSLDWEDTDLFFLIIDHSSRIQMALCYQKPSTQEDKRTD